MNYMITLDSQWNQSYYYLGGIYFYLFIFKYATDFERERKKERCERNIDLAPTGMKPTTWVYALTRNRAGDLLVHRRMFNQLNHTVQGGTYFR